MNQEDKIVAINNMFKSAEADKDVGRQEQLLSYQADIEIERITTLNGFDIGMAELNDTFAEARSTQNFLQMQVLNGQEFAWRSRENALNRVIDEARNELLEKGIDADIVEDQFNRLLETGVSIDTIEAWLTDSFSGQNLTITFPSDSDLNQAIISTYNTEALEWLLTNPQWLDPNGTTFTDNKGTADPSDDETFGILGEGQDLWNKHLNETLYGQQFGQTTTNTEDGVLDTISDTGEVPETKSIEIVSTSGKGGGTEDIEIPIDSKPPSGTPPRRGAEKVGVDGQTYVGELVVTGSSKGVDITELQWVLKT